MPHPPNATQSLPISQRIVLSFVALVGLTACPPFSPSLAASDDADRAVTRRTELGGFGATELDVVVADRDLVMPGVDSNRANFNPSMVPYGDGALLAFRTDAPTRGNFVDMRIGIVALDANFAFSSNVTLLDLRFGNDLLHSAEDPRLVWHNEALYVLFNQRDKGHSYFPRSMHIARIGLADAAGTPLRKSNEHRRAAVPATFTVESKQLLVAPPPIPKRRVEKNWTPYSLAGDLWLSYQTNPPIALRLTDDMLESDSSLLIPLGPVTGAPTVRYGFGEMRGGTGAAPAIDYLHDANQPAPELTPWAHLNAAQSPNHWAGDGNGWAEGAPAVEPPEALFAMDPNALYESFFHAQRIDVHKRRNRYVYTIGYHAFRAAPPFAIARMLPVPLAVPGADAIDPDTFTCSYPGGFIRRGPYYHVAYGRGDRAIAILTLDANALLARTTSLAIPSTSSYPEL